MSVFILAGPVGVCLDWQMILHCMSSLMWCARIFVCLILSNQVEPSTITIKKMSVFTLGWAPWVSVWIGRQVQTSTITIRWCFVAKENVSLYTGWAPCLDWQTSSDVACNQASHQQSQSRKCQSLYWLGPVGVCLDWQTSSDSTFVLFSDVVCNCNQI